MFVSTGPSPAKANFKTTLGRPIPEQGHLWVPETLPRPTWPAPNRPLWEFVNAVLTPIVGVDCRDACRKALGEFPIALESSSKFTYLQLHLGPTLSFKDVGCRVAAELHRMFDAQGRVVVATSGDTGSAAAHAFDNICVLYPKDRVSPFQEAQMLDSKRAVAFAVPGDFDECQRIAKKMLSNHEALSCNSVSLARLLPQIGIYAWAAARLPERVFFIPSGNYGNAVSCLMAKKMGAPIQAVHMACNENGRALVQFLKENVYNPTDTIATPATAMDVGRPSNFVRLCHYMEPGDVTASVVESGQIQTMTDQTTCPHTSCAILAALRCNVPGSIIVRTAAATKFRNGGVTRAPLVLRRPATLRKRARALVLVGMPGVGKTTVSFMMGGHDADHTMVAERGKFALPEVIDTFADADAFLEYEGATVVRMLEAAVQGSVVATGGSAVHSDALRSYLKSSDDVVVVWLRQNARRNSDWSADWATRGVVVPRGMRIETPEQVCAIRVPLYADVADVELWTDVWDAERCAIALERLMGFLRPYGRSA